MPTTKSTILKLQCRNTSNAQSVPLHKQRAQNKSNIVEWHIYKKKKLKCHPTSYTLIEHIFSNFVAFCHIFTFETSTILIRDPFHKSARKQSGSAVLHLRAVKPAVVSATMHHDYVALLYIQLIGFVCRIIHDSAVPKHGKCDIFW